MPLIVKEESRETISGGESPSASREYSIWDTDDPAAAEAALLNGTDAFTDGAHTLPFTGIPATIGNTLYKGHTLDRDEGRDTLWRAVVQWGKRQTLSPQQQGEIRTYSRSAIRMVRVKTSRQTVGQFAAPWFNGGVAQDFKNLVGVNEDGTVEGVEVPEPYTVNGVRAVLDKSTVTDAYRLQAQSIVGKLNDAIYRGAPIRTLRGSSVIFNELSDDDVEVSAEFEYAEHLTGLSSGDITGINKEAWDYIWPFTQKRKGDASVKPETAQINVERVHEEADFATALGF